MNLGNSPPVFVQGYQSVYKYQYFHSLKLKKFKVMHHVFRHLKHKTLPGKNGFPYSSLNHT